MAEAPNENATGLPSTPVQSAVPDIPSSIHDDSRESQDDGADDEETEGPDEEPKLKYHRLTDSLTSAYKNGDATSSFLVSGDKLVSRLNP
jgi:vacuolar protein sorting-associated protein 41